MAEAALCVWMDMVGVHVLDATLEKAKAIALDPDRPALMQRTNSCATCWYAWFPDMRSEGRGYCRRNAPVAGAGTARTHVEMWCGEYTHQDTPGMGRMPQPLKG